MTISNYELAKLAKRHKVRLKLPDIFMIENLVKLKPKKFINVILNINSDVSKEGHFVCFIVRDGNAFYFDSFGNKPSDIVIDYCVNHRLKLGFNKTAVQHSSSTNCGVYCFALLKYIGESPNLYEKCDKFIDLFESVGLERNADVLHTVLLKMGVKHEYK